MYERKHINHKPNRHGKWCRRKQPFVNIPNHFQKTDVTGQTLNNSMKPLKYRQIYVYVAYPTYLRLHIVIQVKLKTMQYVSAIDTHNRYDYVSARQHNNYFI